MLDRLRIFPVQQTQSVTSSCHESVSRFRLACIISSDGQITQKDAADVLYTSSNSMTTRLLAASLNAGAVVFQARR